MGDQVSAPPDKRPPPAGSTQPQADPGESGQDGVAPSTIQARQLAPITAAYAAVALWLASLGLITTPFLLHGLGASAYAIFALINLVLAYLSNLEFGFGHGTVRFLARARAEGDQEAESRIIGTSLSVFTVASIIAAVITFFGAPVIVKSFADFPDSLQDDAVVAVRLGAVVIAASLMSNFLTAALQVHGQFPALIKNRLVIGTLLSVGAVVATALFGDIRAVLAVQVVLVVTSATVLFVTLARVSRVRLWPSFHSGTFKAMGAFGVLILATGLATQAMVQGPPTVLAGSAPSGELAAFAVPALILTQLVTLVGAASVGFLPFASGQSVERDRTHLADVFNSHVRLTLIVMGPIAAYLAVFAYSLLAAWVGPSFASSAAVPLRFLGVAALFISLSAPPSDITRALGKPSWALIYTLTAGAVGIAVSIAAVNRWGADGAAVGLLVGVAVTTPILLLVVATRLLSQSLRSFTRSLIAPLLGILGTTLLWALASLLDGGLLVAILAGGVVTAIYAPVAWRFVLSRRERDALRSGFAGLLRSVRLLRQRRRAPLDGTEPT
jgi:O-antigen/teichoic acid export membrane protein